MVLFTKREMGCSIIVVVFLIKRSSSSLLLSAGLGRGQPIKIIFWLIMKIIIAAVKGKKKCWAGEADLHLPRTLSGCRSAIPLHLGRGGGLSHGKWGYQRYFLSSYRCSLATVVMTLHYMLSSL